MTEQEIHQLRNDGYDGVVDLIASLEAENAKLTAELEAQLKAAQAEWISLNQFSYAFWTVNGGDMAKFYKWLAKYNHLSVPPENNP